MNKTIMQKIIPHLWFDNSAGAAAKFYTSIFKNSKILDTAHYEESAAEVSGRPKGTVMTVTFELEGQRFMALNGGPFFKFSPAISFFVNCETQEEVNDLWETQQVGQGITKILTGALN
jgi:predicted 3-demethylubiquinone-9 3-methyltransferase (glyoxalase superfamily)